MERVGGIEPPASAWKAKVLPLYDTREQSERGAYKILHCFLTGKEFRNSERSLYDTRVFLFGTPRGVRLAHHRALNGLGAR